MNLQAYCIFGLLISKLQQRGSTDLRGQEWQEISSKEARNNMQVSTAPSPQPCPTFFMVLLLPGPPTMKATNSNPNQQMTSDHDTSNSRKQRTWNTLNHPICAAQHLQQRPPSATISCILYIILINFIF